MTSRVACTLFRSGRSGIDDLLDVVPLALIVSPLKYEQPKLQPANCPDLCRVGMKLPGQKIAVRKSELGRRDHHLGSRRNRGGTFVGRSAGNWMRIPKRSPHAVPSSRSTEMREMLLM